MSGGGSGKRSVAVRISGQEYRIRSEAAEASLQAVARFVDETMDRIRTRTGAIDSVEVALLTALNLARDLLALREDVDAEQGQLGVDADRVRALIERVEAVGTSVAP